MPVHYLATAHGKVALITQFAASPVSDAVELLVVLLGDVLNVCDRVQGQ